MDKKAIIETIERAKYFQSAKDKLKTLQINWEMDLSEMIFSDLNSFMNKKCYLSGKIQGVEFINTPERDIHIGRFTDGHLNFIHFASTGKKVIPPFFAQRYEIREGKEIRVPQLDGFPDGNHRADIASLIGLEEIPVVVIKQTDFVFELEKCDFDFSGNELTFVNRLNSDKTTFDIESKEYEVYMDIEGIRVREIRELSSQS